MYLKFASTVIRSHNLFIMNCTLHVYQTLVLATETLRTSFTSFMCVKYCSSSSSMLYPATFYGQNITQGHCLDGRLAYKNVYGVIVFNCVENTLK